MAERYCKNWRELCNAAIAARDIGELLRIIQDLNGELEREQKIRRSLPESQVSDVLGNISVSPQAGAERGAN